MIYVGIDPGLTGAIAFLKEDNYQLLVDMPVIKIGKRHDYVVSSLVAEFSRWSYRDMMVGLESLHAMPKSMCSVMGNFSLGRASGLLEGILVALRISFQVVPPQRWKKYFLDGLPKEKGSSVVVAKRLFPGVDLSLKKHHGRADALLIAEYVRRSCQNKNS